MKKAILSSILLFSSFTGFSQLYVNFEIGYNAQFGNPKGINYIVDRYNETRNYLDQEMKSFNNLDGLTASFGFVYGAYIDLGFIGRGQRREATGTYNGEKFTRHLRVRNHGMSLGIGIPLISDEIKIIPGTRVDFTFPRISTKIIRENPDPLSDEDEWTDIYTGTSTYIAPFIKIIIGPVNFEPYYAFGERKLGDIAVVNQKLNPDTYAQDPKSILFNHRGFGFRLTLSLFGEASS